MLFYIERAELPDVAGDVIRHATGAKRRDMVADTISPRFSLFDGSAFLWERIYHNTLCGVGACAACIGTAGSSQGKPGEVARLEKTDVSGISDDWPDSKSEHHSLILSRTAETPQRCPHSMRWHGRPSCRGNMESQKVLCQYPRTMVAPHQEPSYLEIYPDAAVFRTFGLVFAAIPRLGCNGKGWRWLHFLSSYRGLLHYWLQSVQHAKTARKVYLAASWRGFVLRGRIGTADLIASRYGEIR